jgi:hypothetical protein
MARTRNIPSIEPVVTQSNLNVTAPILLASMMLMIFAMVASAASGFS